MRLQQVRTKAYNVLPRTVTRNSEGAPVVTYGEPFTVRGYRWNATSARQIERYGDRIVNVSNMRVSGHWTLGLADNVLCATENDGRTIRLGDGLRVYSTDAPDYEVKSISTYDGTLLMEVERHG